MGLRASVARFACPLWPAALRLPALAACFGCLLLELPALLDRAHGFSAWAFGALAHLVFHPLPFLQLFHADALERGEMKEKVFSPSGVNETEPALGD
jgi:hypothetical protein